MRDFEKEFLKLSDEKKLKVVKTLNNLTEYLGLIFGVLNTMHDYPVFKGCNDSFKLGWLTKDMSSKKDDVDFIIDDFEDEFKQFEFTEYYRLVVKQDD